MNTKFNIKYNLFNLDYLKPGMVISPKGYNELRVITKIDNINIYTKRLKDRLQIICSKKNFTKDNVLVKFLDMSQYQYEMMITPDQLKPFINKDKRIYNVIIFNHVKNNKTGKIYRITSHRVIDNIDIFTLTDYEEEIILKKYSEMLSEYMLIESKYKHIIGGKYV